MLRNYTPAYRNIVIIVSVALGLYHGAASGLLHVRLLTVPPDPNGYFTGMIDGGSETDPTPNPCYHREGCLLAAFVNSKSWGPNGQQGYNSVDRSYKSERASAVRNARTLGEAVVALKKVGLLHISMTDYLQSGLAGGDDPTFCVYAATIVGLNPTQEAGTLMSNCVDAPPPPTDCHITTPSIDYDFGTMSPGTTQTLVQNVGIECNRRSDLILSIAGEYIVLGGDDRQRAVVDLGKGPGKPNHISVEDTAEIPVSVQLQGMDQPGSFLGSSILVIASP